MVVSIGGKFSDGKEMFETAGYARYTSVFMGPIIPPERCPEHRLADILVFRVCQGNGNGSGDVVFEV